MVMPGELNQFTIYGFDSLIINFVLLCQLIPLLLTLWTTRYTHYKMWG